MPRRKSTVSLRELCLVAVAKSIDYWCRDYVDNFKGQKVLYVIGPFDCLPQSVVHDLFVTLKELRLIRRPHLDLLIHPGTDKLDLSRRSSHEIPIPYSINLIGRVCKNLKHLDLSFCDKLSQNVFSDMAHTIPQIVTLNLRSTGCTDAILSMLGGHCPELRDLDVSWCPITDDGISGLCINMDDVSNSGSQRRLKIVSLLVAGTTITDRGAIVALLHLPFLHTFDYPNNCRALESIHRPDSDGTLPQYELMTLHYDCERNSCVSRWSLQVASITCPRITKICLANANMTNDDLLLLSSFEQLNDLSLGTGPECPISYTGGVGPLLQIVGGQLTSLLLVEITDVDVRHIGTSCPQLINLHLMFINGYATFTSDDTNKSFDRPFARLVHVKIVCNEASDIPAAHMRLVLGHCNELKTVYLQRCQTLTDAVLSDVLNSNPMSHLTEMELEYCNTLTVASVMSLFSLDNPLQSLKTWWCKGITRSDYMFLQELVRQENLDTTVEWS